MTGYALTRAADADLTEIGRYTAKRWGYEQAEAYLLGLEAMLRAWQLFPIPADHSLSGKAIFVSRVVDTLCFTGRSLRAC